MTLGEVVPGESCPCGRAISGRGVPCRVTRRCPQAGDTVGVVRRDDGTLHFFVNGAAQGPAAWNVPPNVYAVVDLYGQAAQATIVEDGGEGWGHGGTSGRGGLGAWGREGEGVG